MDEIVSLGEGGTPLVEMELEGCPLHLKLEFLAPTGSFKDRGASVLVSALLQIGVREVTEDSSGNAGASLAAYCARAGIEVHLYIPDHASPGKVAQIEAYGAHLHPIPGPRERAAQAAGQAARGGYYASHYWNPLPLEGIKTEAYEIAEALGWRAPDNVVLPVGQGSHLLGLYRGFDDLLKAKAIANMPRLYGVQARACAPLYEAFWGREGALETKLTVAEGICIRQPIHKKAILEAVRATQGEFLAVGEEDILQARRLLARKGLYVEPTSAVPVAALKQLRARLSPGEITVIPLTGSGLKGVPQRQG